MKAHGFSGVFRLSILIGAAVFHFAGAATPPGQIAQTTRSQQGRQVNQSNNTKNKQTTTNANSALKEKQSKNSQLGSNAQRRDADSRLRVESPGSEYRPEKAALIATGIGAVLSAIHKPAPSPPAPPPVVAKTTPAEQKTALHKRTRPKSSDDDVWSRINPVSK